VGLGLVLWGCCWVLARQREGAHTWGEGGRRETGLLGARWVGGNRRGTQGRRSRVRQQADILLLLLLVVPPVQAT
jgi:hypothetical protein